MRLVTARRQYRRVLKNIEFLEKQHTLELKEIRSHYERRLEAERLKVEAITIASYDRFLQLQGLLATSYQIERAAERVDEVIDPQFKPPQPDPTDSLTSDQYSFFLDSKDNFFQAERISGKSEPEISRIWESEFKQIEIERSKALIQ